MSGGVEEALSIGEGLVVVSIFGHPDGFVVSVLLMGVSVKWEGEDLRPSNLTQMGC